MCYLVNQDEQTHLQEVVKLVGTQLLLRRAHLVQMVFWRVVLFCALVASIVAAGVVIPKHVVPTPQPTTSPKAFTSSEEFIAKGIIDNANDCFLAKIERNGDGTVRVTMQKIVSTVQWIDDPAIFAFPSIVSGFLANNIEIRVGAFQFLNDLLLDHHIDFRHQLVTTFSGHFDAIQFGDALSDDFTGIECGVYGHIECAGGVFGFHRDTRTFE